MPVKQIPIPVPKFSPYQIKLAEVCATALWEGVSFETGLPGEVSDEVLLNNFHIAFQKIVKNPNKPSSIDEAQLRQLIRVGKVKAMFRSTLPVDFQKGIDSIRNHVVPIYLQTKIKKAAVGRLEASTSATLELSKNWVNNPNPSLNGNYRVPFSTRILFFACPEMCVFNYSKALEKAMQLQTRPQAAIKVFNKLMEDGLVVNRVLLSQCELPVNTAMSIANWNRVAKTDWWQRRVLDLAMLIHYKISVPHVNNIKKAKTLIKNKVK